MRWERVQQVGLGDSSSGPRKRWGHTCNAIKDGRFVYVFGGFGSGHCLTNQVHVLDVETQIWTQPEISGVAPCPRDSHTCTTVGDNLVVFGGTDGKNHLKDLYILDTSSHTWFCPDVRGQGPEARESHSAALVDKRLFIFGGCGKSSGSDDEVIYDDLYILNTETFVWKRAVTTGDPPSARDSHTCSTWRNNIVVVGGEDLDDSYLNDVHILDTDTLVWRELTTKGQWLSRRAGHVTVAHGRNLFVFGGFTDSQNVHGDLSVLNLETGVWSIIAKEGGPSARFSVAAVCLDPYKAGSFFFIGGCNENLEPLDDMYYLDQEGGYDAWFYQNPERLSLSERRMINYHGEKLPVARTNIDQRKVNLPTSIGPIHQGKTTFQARVTENIPLGYTIETIIDGKLLNGVVFSNRHGSVQTADPSFGSRERPTMSIDDYDHAAKKSRTLSKDSAGCSQQADPVASSDDANKKVTESNDMDTPMINTADNTTIVSGTQEAGAAASVTSDVKDQDPSLLNENTLQDTVNEEPSPVTADQDNVEALRNEISTNGGAAAQAGPEEHSSPHNKEDGPVAAEDAKAEQLPQLKQH